MAIIIRRADPNVPYDGKILPRDKVPYTPYPINPDVPYAGKTLPQDAVTYQRTPIDQSNQPGLIVLGTLAAVASPFAGVVTSPAPVTGASLPNGGVVLPADVVIQGEIEKIIADTTIIDGVQVTEHIRRNAIPIEFEFTIRAKSQNDYIFGQDFLDTLFQKILIPNTVIYVQNTLLNRIGITQLICRRGQFTTQRGKVNIPMVIRFTENVPGESLIVS